MAAKRRPLQYTSLLFAALAVAASLHALAPVPMPTAMAAPVLPDIEAWYSELKEGLQKVIDEAAHNFWDDIPPLPGDGNKGGGSGVTAQSDAISFIGTGTRTLFSVAAVDITARLTRTSLCNAGGTGQPVPCSDPACSTYAPQSSCASSPNPSYCAYDNANVLYQGPITMASSLSDSNPYSQKKVVYACRVQALGASSSSNMAVLGLGRRGTGNLLLQRFSYSVASNGKISVSVGGVGGYHADVAQGGSTGTAKLLSDGSYPDLYYVRVTGIDVGKDRKPVPFQSGALDLRQDGSGGGVFLSTTMPFTLLNQDVYVRLTETLKQELASASPTSSKISSQLCYSSGTHPPTITLVLDDGAATMKLSMENCWYERRADGALCLGILPTPWATGESVLGTMTQIGWRMTYDLTAETLTFQSLSSSTLQQEQQPRLLLLSSFTVLLLL